MPDETTTPSVPTWDDYFLGIATASWTSAAAPEELTDDVLVRLVELAYTRVEMVTAPIAIVPNECPW